MKVVIWSSSLLLLVIIFSLKFEPCMEDIVPVSKNFFIFERVNCRTYDGSKASSMICRVKYIDRNNLKALILVNLTGPVEELRLHGIFYYKYNTYMKIATELWDDLCGWLDGKHKSFYLEFLRRPFFKNSNVNHSCPYSGFILAKTDNISAQYLALPQIMPAGRYRFELNVTHGKRRTVLFGGSMYFTISDHRIEVV